MMTPIVCTIAGSDSSGGAGIQADLKTFLAREVYGASVVTTLTAQNTREVSDIFPVPADFVKSQLDAVFSDMNIQAVKIGMVGSGETVRILAERLAFWKRRQKFFLTLDPVLKASTGTTFLAAADIDLYKRLLFPLADLITPNIDEAAVLLGEPVIRSEAEMNRQAQRLMGLKARFVLLKGGHLPGNNVKDLLYDGRDLVGFSAPRVKTENSHGTGCTLSAAITAEITKGRTLVGSIEQAKIYVTEALQLADRLSVGTGSGPLNHGFFHG